MWYFSLLNQGLESLIEPEKSFKNYPLLVKIPTKLNFIVPNQ